MNVRQKRLQADYDMILALFSNGIRIRLLKTIGNPPEKYQISIQTTGLQKNLSTNKLKTCNSFIVEITLTGGYPRLAPQCKMITPAFHPNIAPHAICIGDHWAAGESLSNLIIRIAEMLSFQSYNVKSPLNGDAASWAEKNQHRLPLDTFDFGSLLSGGVRQQDRNSSESSQVCSNCGASSSDKQLCECSNGHIACPDCAITCDRCGKTLCLKCRHLKCDITHKLLCVQCAFKCRSCSSVVSHDEVAVCHICKLPFCSNCVITCSVCHQPVCIQHIVKKTTAENIRRYVCQTCDAESIDDISSKIIGNSDEHSSI